MLLLTLNTIFAWIFGQFAWRALPKGTAFIQHGWLLLQTHAEQPDAAKHVEHRRAVSEGGTYMIAGVLWCGAGLIAAGLAVAFGIEVIRALLA